MNATNKEINEISENDRYTGNRVSMMASIVDMINKSSMSELEKDTILLDVKMMANILKQDLPENHPYKSMKLIEINRD